VRLDVRANRAGLGRGSPSRRFRIERGARGLANIEQVQTGEKRVIVQGALGHTISTYLSLRDSWDASIFLAYVHGSGRVDAGQL
jgi:hypothetical protein